MGVSGFISYAIWRCFTYDNVRELPLAIDGRSIFILRRAIS
jgi:hypothetical protein